MILLVLLALLTSWWSWLQYDGRVGYEVMMKRPASLDGQEVTLSLMEVTAITDANHYDVKKGGVHLEVRGPTAGLVVGEEVSVGGVFHASGRWVDEGWRADAPLRPWKKRFGYVGLIVIAGLVAFGIRREGRELAVVG